MEPSQHLEKSGKSYHALCLGVESSLQVEVNSCSWLGWELDLPNLSQVPERRTCCQLLAPEALFPWRQLGAVFMGSPALDSASFLSLAEPGSLA